MEEQIDWNESASGEDDILDEKFDDFKYARHAG